MDNIPYLQLVNWTVNVKSDWVAKSIVQKLGTSLRFSAKSASFDVFHNINVAKTLIGVSRFAIFIFMIHRNLA